MNPQVEFFLLIVFICTSTNVIAGKQRLLVVLLDGMRWDYVTRDTGLEGFKRISKEGVTVQHVTPIFPSSSYPNWYTITTGLHGESHGIISNFMYDPVRQDSFLMGPHPNVSHEHWWNKTEPIWVTAEKNGINTAMHYWDGCQVPIHGVTPTLCESYRPFWSWPNVQQDTLSKMADVLEWFEEKDSNRLALVYYEGPDAFGHRFGPDSSETRQQIRQTSWMLDNFQNLLEASSIKDQINLIVVSDHGMTDIQRAKVLYLDDVKGKEDIQIMLEAGTQGGIIPVPGKEQQLYENLQNNKIDGVHVYKKENIPEEFHMKKSELAMPILMVADLGTIMRKPNSARNPSAYSIGEHGYVPYNDVEDEMKTIMFARGPAFRKGLIGGPIHQTDHYNVFAYILELPAHPNNGSWDRVQELLMISNANSHKQLTTWTILLLSIVVSYQSL